MLFVQDGNSQAHGESQAAVVVEAGGAIKGHVYMSMVGTARNVRVSLSLTGRWVCVWKALSANYDTSAPPKDANGTVDGTLEATKTVIQVKDDINVGTLMRGEHGMPAVLYIPVAAPPSLATPKSTCSTTLSDPDSNQVPVPMFAKCSYTLVVTAVSESVEDDTQTFTIPVIVLAPSGLRAAVLRNQPRPLYVSNAGRLSVPCSIQPESAKISPFSYPRNDPLDPALRKLPVPASVRPIVDREKVLYDLDVPRLHHYIGDMVPFTMAIKPKPQFATYTTVHSVTASLISHIFFRLPTRLYQFQQPPSNAIAVRLHTETFPWENHADDPSSISAKPRSNSIAAMGGGGPGVVPRRFFFSLPEDITCPTLSNTAQNTLPLEVFHILRISVRLMTPTSDPEDLNSLQPISAVRVSEVDDLVLDIPIVLVGKGRYIHLWGIPRVPRGWRVGQAVAIIAEKSSQHSSDGAEVVVMKSAVESSSGSGSNSHTRRSSAIIDTSSIANLASEFFRVFGAPGKSTGPDPKVHPKFTAEELTRMAEEAMRTGNIRYEDKPPPATRLEVIQEQQQQQQEMQLRHIEFQREQKHLLSHSVPDASDAAVPADAVADFDEVIEEDEFADPAEAGNDAGNMTMDDATDQVPMLVMTDARKSSLDGMDEQIEEEEDPALAVQPMHSAQFGNVAGMGNADVNDDFASFPVPQNSEEEKEDQLKKELEQGVDEAGRFLPLFEFAGRYRVLYPYLEGLRPDEIRLSVGDIVDVSVSYVDGWAKGVNETTGEEGFVPLHCLVAQRNAAVEDGRVLGKWFNSSLAHQVELPNDWKYLCQCESRFTVLKDMMTTFRPAAGTLIEMPPSAHISFSQKRIASAWIENEKCASCYAQAAPEVWDR
ncbi:hypothetical protein HDU84_006534 [Entophlyctis sp. JEL0112]|nr:hypothetical protein HDU84_006534 [Entophlyctis sp. JEL0112]